MRDKSIPREWFHLPQGVEPPTVDELLRDTSPEEDEDNPFRTASPPICGRGRSKSRERKLRKHNMPKLDERVAKTDSLTSPGRDEEEKIGKLIKIKPEQPNTPHSTRKPETNMRHHRIDNAVIVGKNDCSYPERNISDEEGLEVGCFKRQVRSKSRSKSNEPQGRSKKELMTKDEEGDSAKTSIFNEKKVEPKEESNGKLKLLQKSKARNANKSQEKLNKAMMAEEIARAKLLARRDLACMRMPTCR